MSFSLKPETLAEIDATVPLYPVTRSAVLPLLHLVQEERGFICKDAIAWIAQRLGLEPINVYEVATFYPGFRAEAPGRRVVRVCRTLPCALVGAYRTCETLCKELGVEAPGGKSADGEFTIEFVECLASCGTAPVALVDEQLHERLDEAATRALAARLKAEAANRPAGA